MVKVFIGQVGRPDEHACIPRADHHHRRIACRARQSSVVRPNSEGHSAPPDGERGDIFIRIDGIKKKETVEAAKPQLAKLDFASISVFTLELQVGRPLVEGQRYIENG